MAAIIGTSGENSCTIGDLAVTLQRLESVRENACTSERICVGGENSCTGGGIGILRAVTHACNWDSGCLSALQDLLQCIRGVNACNVGTPLLKAKDGVRSTHG